jgi:transposase-like protein
MMEKKLAKHREVFMAASEGSKPRTARRHLPPAEKRRIVELTLRAGASVPAIAREHGVHPNSVHQWRTLYRSGALDAPVNPTPRVAGSAASATFVPVSLVSEVRSPQPAAHSNPTRCCSGILQLVLASGDTLRIEIGALDAALVCALVAELRR